MERRIFGRTGVSVSKQCLGAMMFGSMGNTDDAECVSMIHTALDAGINFIDTADGYSGGHSEEVVGEALKGRRDDVVLATKVFFPMDAEPNHMGGSRRWIIQEVENSLRRLQTDHIDLYQLHRVDPNTDLEDTLSAMDQLVRDGKIRYVGMSATPAEWIVEAQRISDDRNVARVRGEQSIYNILNRGIESGVLPTCQRYGIGVLTYAPLNGGWLTGKYKPEAEVDPDSRAGRGGGRYGDRYNIERAVGTGKIAAVEALEAVAKDSGIPLTHLATAFVTEHPAVTSVIIGPRTPEQLADSLAGADVSLDADVLDAIDDIVPIGRDLDPADTLRPDPGLSRSARRRG